MNRNGRLTRSVMALPIWNALQWPQFGARMHSMTDGTCFVIECGGALHLVRRG
jgi:hypothetical protein